MLEAAVALRYSRALYQAAGEQGSVKKVRRELEEVLKTLRHQERLAKVLNQPMVSFADKKAALHKQFSHLSALSLNFLILLTQKRRLALLPRMLHSFASLDDEAQQIQRAQCLSPYPLSAAVTKKIETALSRWSGRKVTLEVIEDAAVVGGLVIKMGDTMLDASVINQLHQLNQSLIA